MRRDLQSPVRIDPSKSIPRSRREVVDPWILRRSLDSSSSILGSWKSSIPGIPRSHRSLDSFSSSTASSPSSPLTVVPTTSCGPSSTSAPTSISSSHPPQLLVPLHEPLSRGFGKPTSCSISPNLRLDSIDGQEGEARLKNKLVNLDEVRDALSYMIVLDELPFRFVEKPGFKHLMYVACPTFKIPSRTTIARDCYKRYVTEKEKLKDMLKTSCQRVCVTTDTWTSIQRINYMCQYMCLTAHFRHIGGGSLELKNSISEQVKMKMRGSDGGSIFVRTEFDRYLDEQKGDDEENEILAWWKLNEPRFPILARMARDVLAIPISTVASESAFSAGGRHLDQFRSSLTPKMVQALLCGQDWIRAELRKPKVDVEEDMEELEQLEKDLENTTLEDEIIFVTESMI